MNLYVCLYVLFTNMDEIYQISLRVMLHNKSILCHEWRASWNRWSSQPPQQGLATRPVGTAMRAMSTAIRDMCVPDARYLHYIYTISTRCLHIYVYTMSTRYLHDVYIYVSTRCLPDIYTMSPNMIYTISTLCDGA